MKAFILLIVLFSASLLVVGYFRADNVNSCPTNVPVSEVVDAPAASVEGLVPAGEAKPAPELVQGTWLNSEALKPGDLRGRVVLLEFWTFGCYNCVNTLPAMKRFHADYADKGFTLIGIETPELDFERVPANLAAAVKKRGIEYPVLTDYEGKNWDAFHVEAWPTIFILDRTGRIRYTHVGEGAYDDEEKVINLLLAEK